LTTGTKNGGRSLTRKTLGDKVSPTTILRYRENLHALFTYAKRLAHVRENPVSNVPRPRVRIRRQPPLNLLAATPSKGERRIEISRDPDTGNFVVVAVPSRSSSGRRRRVSRARRS
jgi:hypothetical protein